VHIFLISSIKLSIIYQIVLKFWRKGGSEKAARCRSNRTIGIGKTLEFMFAYFTGIL